MTKRRAWIDRRPAGLVLPLLLTTACPPSEPSSDAVDSKSEAGPPALASEAHGFRLPLARKWVPIPPPPSEPLIDVIAAARRRPDDTTFTVTPRIRVTVEPSRARSAERAYRAIKSDIEGFDERPNTDLLRSSLGFRPIGANTIGDLNVRYRVGGPTGREIRQRSLLIWRDGLAGATVLTITALYLARDLERIEPEVQSMFSGLELLEPKREGQSP